MTQQIRLRTTDLNTILGTMSPFTLAQWIVDLELTTGNEEIITQATKVLEAIVGCDEAAIMIDQVSGETA